MRKVIVKTRHVTKIEDKHTPEESCMDAPDTLEACMTRHAGQTSIPELLRLYAQARIDDPDHRIRCNSDKHMQEEILAFKRIIFLMGYSTGHKIRTDIPSKHALNVGTLIMNNGPTSIVGPHSVREARKKRKNSRIRKQMIKKQNMLRAAVLEELLKQLAVVFPQSTHLSNQH